jgi:RNA polymerase sigma factor (TIGR02999 family)
MASLDATTLLLEWRDGSRDALDRLFPLVYEDLRHRASRALRGERDDHTLTTTALVHETYLKLLDVTRVRIQDRAHFLALAATAMRRVLVDYARHHRAQKRGGGAAPVPLTADGAVVVSADRAEQMLSLDEALERLTRINPRHARMVELRFFGGMTVEQTAEALDLATSTVKLDWQKAKEWLYRELAEQ